MFFLNEEKMVNKGFIIFYTKILHINIDEESKNKLRGAIKFFCGDKNNMPIQIINGDKKDLAGGIYITDTILSELQELIGKERIKIEEI